MQVGSIVECIAPHKGGSSCHKNKPVLGGVYIIRGIRRSIKEPGQWGITLEEIHNDLVEYSPGVWLEPGFYIYRFRELLPPSDKALTIDELIKQQA